MLLFLILVVVAGEYEYPPDLEELQTAQASERQTAAYLQDEVQEKINRAASFGLYSVVIWRDILPKLFLARLAESGYKVIKRMPEFPWYRSYYEISWEQ